MCAVLPVAFNVVCSDMCPCLHVHLATVMAAVAFGMLAPYAMCACAYRAANVFAFAVVIDDSSPPLFLEAAIGLLLIVASKLYIYIYI